MPAYIPEYLKSKNRKVVFDLFAKYKTLSRAEIVQKTEMSFPTVSKAVDFLISRDIVREAEGEPEESNGPGRKRHRLEFNSSAYCALAVNFEGKFAEIGLVDLSGNVLFFETLEFEDFTNRELQKELGIYLEEIIQSSPNPVLGLGMGLPFNVNPDTKEIISFSKKGVFESTSFKEMFAPMLEQISVDFFIENDVNMACLGVMASQYSMEKEKSLCYLSLGTGFGSGVMIQGKLWRGNDFRAGEIGHTLFQTLDFSKPLREQVIFLEDTINISAIDEKFKIHLLEMEDIPEGLKREIIEFILPGLVTSVYNFVTLFDIEEYVLSGYVFVCLGQALIDRMNECLKDLWAVRKRKLHLCAPESPYVALIGAAQMVFEETILKELKD